MGGIKMQDLGPQKVLLEDGVTIIDAYVRRVCHECSCGETLEGYVKVDKELADLNGDPQAFVDREVMGFQTEHIMAKLVASHLREKHQRAK